MTTSSSNLLGDEIEEDWPSEAPAVAAIVPAYNEVRRVGRVLEALSGTERFQEIIVVDDGSTDGTDRVVTRFESVAYLRNETNMGKSYSMQRGVEATDVPVLFFCDADVEGLNPKTIGEMLNPVLNDEADMFIGIRNNTMQKAFTTFAINSGERALKRELWDDLPSFYKHRYRIETGLNYLAKLRGARIKYKILEHYHSIKELKHGVIKGTLLRWWMNYDVALAILRSRTIDRYTIGRTPLKRHGGVQIRAGLQRL